MDFGSSRPIFPLVRNDFMVDYVIKGQNNIFHIKAKVGPGSYWTQIPLDSSHCTPMQFIENELMQKDVKELIDENKIAPGSTARILITRLF